MRILVADDDQNLCRTIKQGLEEQGFAVDCVHDGTDALFYADVTGYDLIILDIMMPKKTGYQVCRNLRTNKNNTPILMLTAKDDIEDRVKGLDLGADDYLVKPFDFNELTARVRAVLRRKNGKRSPVITLGNLQLNTVTYKELEERNQEHL